MDQQRLITEFLRPNSTPKQDPSPALRIISPRNCKASSRHNIESDISPFLTLPAEIRLQIYRHVLVSKAYAELHYCTSKKFRLIPKEPSDCPLEIDPKVLLTCRDINKEATPVLYSENFFRRGYCWPRRYAVRQHRLWPICDTSPVSKVNFAYISRIHLFRDYDHWFCDGELKIFNEIPNLKDLDIHIDQNDWADRVNMSELPYQTLKAIRQDLQSFQMEIRLDFSEKAHKDWLAKCKDRKKENFSIHLDKKRALETWFEHEGLFTDRSLFWRFKTQRSEWCGPSCNISFAFDNKRKEYGFIDLEFWDDSDGKFGRLKISEENASSCTVLRSFIQMGKELCEMPIQDNRQEYRAVIVVFATLTFSFVMLRIASKIITKSTWGADDTWAVVTFVCWPHICNVYADDGQFILIPFTVFSLLAIHHGVGLAAPLFTKKDLSFVLKEIFIHHLLYVCSLAAAKTSILFFYLRIFTESSFRMLVWVTHAFNALSTVIIITLSLTLGRPVTYLLGGSSDDVVSMNKFSSSIKIVLAHCVVNLALDIWMLILPMTQLYNIGLKLNKKISVMAMFGLGLFLTVVSLVRTIYQSRLLAKPEEAPTLCSTLVGTFTSSMGLWDRVKEKRKQAKRDTTQDEEIKKLKAQVEQNSRARDEVEASFQRSGALINREFEDGYQRYGQRYAIGDVITENKLQAQVIALQQTVINVLQDAVYNGRQLDRADMARLIAASDAAREGSLGALRQQRERLMDLEEPPMPKALPPPKRASTVIKDDPLYCRYALDLQYIPERPLASTFEPRGDCRCPACDVFLDVEADDAWAIGKTATRVITEQGGYKREIDEELEFHISPRFVIKCHTPEGEFACVLCSRFRDGDVLCPSADTLVNHIGREHTVAEMEREPDFEVRSLDLDKVRPVDMNKRIMPAKSVGSDRRSSSGRSVVSGRSVIDAGRSARAMSVDRRSVDRRSVY
ncbi:hypothetical protein FPCIR_13300 [Fusarium pseudocircinatum]|uniref:Rhodopsin domain-containing protein n=1 Tax=Fusarium pseudocircinatum TaxID=56676 RepID=A0A8H5NQJ8_9HYPO|nr:hypothetical protein FPCIR_13300 [Fusarium pseudocircinatum]